MPDTRDYRRASSSSGRSRASDAARPGCRSTSSSCAIGTHATPSLSPSGRRSPASIRRAGTASTVVYAQPPWSSTDRAPRTTSCGNSPSSSRTSRSAPSSADSPWCSAPPGVPQVPPWCDQEARCCRSTSGPRVPSRCRRMPAAPARPQWRWPWAQVVQPSVEASTRPVNPVRATTGAQGGVVDALTLPTGDGQSQTVPGVGSVGPCGPAGGHALGSSDWHEVTQEHVNQFAEATGDHQWIHVDVERAKAESPFGGPIAHGYLTLSLLAPLSSQVLRVTDTVMGVNYGLNKVRFPSPVPVGAKVRLTASLKSVEEVTGGLQLTLAAVIEREGGDKPVCIAEPVYRYYG